MKRLTKIAVSTCLLLSASAFAQLATPESVMEKMNRISSRLTRQAHQLPNHKLDRLDQLLDDMRVTLNSGSGRGGGRGRGGGHPGGGRPGPGPDPGRGRGGYYDIEMVKVIKAGASKASYSSERVAMKRKAISLLNDYQLTRILDMCSVSGSSTMRMDDCINRGLDSLHYEVVADPQVAANVIKQMCKAGSASTMSQDSCFKAAVAQTQDPGMDMVIRTCSAHTYSSERVRCYMRGL
jgi:hypothetical protein